MNLLSQFDQIFSRTERGTARITGQRGGGKLVAQTESGATILLDGEMETDKKVYYDRVSSKVLGEAPDVVYSEYGV
ncbi:hypothetical protein [Psychrobacter sp. 1Y4]|uniref:hypothetical protein n=1 Tax=Psychrobacter sp. 1Y4 TaxID=3453575 RepID=UPI00264A956B|nr:hypothetical protein [Psychrobacter sp.]